MERSEIRGRSPGIRHSPGLHVAPSGLRHFPGLRCAPSGLRDRAVSPTCQPARAKTFHFTEIRICRMCRPSRLILEGRSCGRHFREPGLRWTRQRRARELRAGRIALREPQGFVRTNGADRSVSPAGFRLRRQGWENRGEMAGRAYGKTVWSWPSLLRSSSCGGGSRVNRRGVGEFREGEGGQKELGSRESTA